jgi:hypothetical protein
MHLFRRLIHLLMRLFRRSIRLLRLWIFFFFGTETRQLVTVGTLFGLAPLVSNSYLAWFAYFVDPLAFGETAYDSYVTASAAFGATAANLIAFALLRLGPKKTLFFIFLQSIVVIIAFAGIYQGHGLSPGSECRLIDLADDKGWTSLYFSIVTWTTLGYGDFVPPNDIRLVAAGEALLGYFTFGTMVGLLTSIAVEPRKISVAPAPPSAPSPAR